MCRFSSAEAARLYEEGWTLTQLARRFGAASSTVASRLHGHGVRLRPRGMRRRTSLDDTDRMVLAWLSEGCSLRSIARRLGVTHQAVSHRLRKARTITAAASIDSVERR